MGAEVDSTTRFADTAPMSAQTASTSVAKAVTAANVHHYRVPSRTRTAIGVIYIVLAPSVLLGVTEGAAPIFLVIIGVAGAFFVWTSLVTLQLGGLYERSDGIANLRPVWLLIRYRSEAWENIVEFKAVKAMVFVVVRDRTPWRLVGVAQGARTRWDGGETLDIVALVNERLEARRRSAPAPLP